MSRPGNIFYAYQRGWQHGASGNAKDARFTGHDDRSLASVYMLGWKDGVDDRMRAAKHAEKLSGYKPKILRDGGDDG